MGDLGGRLRADHYSTLPAETGYSFTKWRQRARLLRALETLAADMLATTTALDPGYQTVGAFIALFRRTFGVTPTKYFALLSGIR